MKSSLKVHHGALVVHLKASDLNVDAVRTIQLATDSAMAHGERPCAACGSLEFVAEGRTLRCANVACKARAPYDCRCGAKPGELHVIGCDMERCALCGDQAIGCDCVYEAYGEATGIDVSDLERSHPEVWKNGAPDAWWVPYDAKVAALGGRMPWSGEYPGCAEAREANLWSRWVVGEGWVRCEREHPDAGEDLNSAACRMMWDPKARRYALRSPLCVKRRLRACVDAWPECSDGGHDPRCCRFPKSCSCTVYSAEQVSDADLEPALVPRRVP